MATIKTHTRTGATPCKLNVILENKTLKTDAKGEFMGINCSYANYQQTNDKDEQYGQIDTNRRRDDSPWSDGFIDPASTLAVSRMMIR